MNVDIGGLARYRCHKLVQAAKIVSIREMARGLDFLLTFDGTAIEHRVTGDWVARHHPQPGGYFVVYDDAYTSFSPAQAFEEGYRPGASAITDDVRAALLLAQAALENVNEPIDGEALEAVTTVLETDRLVRTMDTP